MADEEDMARLKRDHAQEQERKRIEAEENSISNQIGTHKIENLIFLFFLIFLTINFFFL